MSASQTWSGLSAVKFRASRFGATGRSWRLSVVRGVRRRPRRAESPSNAVRWTAHHSLDAPARMPQPFPAELGVDAWRAVNPPAGGEDAADPPTQFGFRFGTAL